MNEESKVHRKDKEAQIKLLIAEWCDNNAIDYSEIAEWHVRLKKEKQIVDIYPQRNKWHNVVKNKRGQYRNVIEFLNVEFIF